MDDRHRDDGAPDNGKALEDPDARSILTKLRAAAAYFQAFPMSKSIFPRRAAPTIGKIRYAYQIKLTDETGSRARRTAALGLIFRQTPLNRGVEGRRPIGP